MGLGGYVFMSNILWRFSGVGGVFRWVCKCFGVFIVGFVVYGIFFVSRGLFCF